MSQGSDSSAEWSKVLLGVLSGTHVVHTDFDEALLHYVVNAILAKDGRIMKQVTVGFGVVFHLEVNDVIALMLCCQ